MAGLAEKEINSHMKFALASVLKLNRNKYYFL
jgi:hypothetical protein